MANAVAPNPQFIPTIDRICDRAMVYIAGAIRRIAVKSIRIQSVSNPHSKPGEPVRTTHKKGVYRNTIERDYNPQTKVLVVGPIRTFANRGAATVPAGGKTVPQMLEYGGDMIGLKPQIILAQDAPKAFRKKLKRNRRKNAKWVVIPRGTYHVAARPTMRLAFNETLTQQNLQAAFASIGVSDTSSIQKVI